MLTIAEPKSSENDQGNRPEIIEQVATRDESRELARAKKARARNYWDETKRKEVIRRYHELCEEVKMSEDEARKIAEVILEHIRGQTEAYRGMSHSKLNLFFILKE